MLHGKREWNVYWCCTQCCYLRSSFLKSSEDQILHLTHCNIHFIPSPVASLIWRRRALRVTAQSRQHQPALSVAPGLASAECSVSVDTRHRGLKTVGQETGTQAEHRPVITGSDNWAWLLRKMMRSWKLIRYRAEGCNSDRRVSGEFCWFDSLIGSMWVLKGVHFSCDRKWFCPFTLPTLTKITNQPSLTALICNVDIKASSWSLNSFKILLNISHKYMKPSSQKWQLSDKDEPGCNEHITVSTR